MTPYKNTQIGWLIIAILLLSTSLIYPSYYYQWGNNPIDFNGVIMMSILLVIIILLFYKMKTIIDNDKIKIIYGIGIIRFTINIQEIRSAQIVRNAWFNGIGIRFIPNGRILNIHGYNTVELKFKYHDRVIRIGSQECDVLKNEIEKRIKSN